MSEDSGEKTESPTPHKLREARKKGQIAKGKELTGAILLLVVFYTLKYSAEFMWNQLSIIMRYSFEQISQPFSADAVGYLLVQVTISFFMIMAPLFVISFVLAIIVEAIQTGFLVSFESLEPDLNKINPIEGFKRFFSLKQYVELAKSLIKMGIVIWILYGVVKSKFYLIIYSQTMTLWGLMAATGDIIMSSIVRISIFYVFIAIADFFYQRWEFLKSMRMSKKEIKEEYKRLEGDPMIKQRQRDAQRQLAMGRQMGAVPGADVVVTNPVHVAVALLYKVGEMKAPIVVAKGKQLIAAQIKQIAEENQIPIVENPPLARALFKETRVGAEIPPEHFQVVAEILAFVFKLKKKRKTR